jgi:putative ABC transport system permease protein
MKTRFSGIRRWVRRWPAHAAAAMLAMTAAVALGGFTACFARVASWSPLRLESRLLLRPLPPADWHAEWTASAVSASAQQEAAFHHLGLVILVLSAVGVLVALISFMTLVLGAASTRRNEIATRAAVGATPLELCALLIRHLLALSGPALFVGMAIALIAATIVERAWPHALVVSEYHVLVLRLFGAGSLIVMIGVASASLLAYLAVVRQPLPAALTSGARATASPGELQLRDALTILQFAGVLTLLSGAATLARESRPEQTATTGVLGDSLLIVNLQLDETAFREPRERVRFIASLRKRVRTLPGVRAESLASAGAWLGLGPLDRVMVECGKCYQAYMYMPTYSPIIRHFAIMPGFFKVLGVDVEEGRAFEDSDDASSERVVLVNRPLAMAHFQHGQPLGRNARPYDLAAHRIVGIVPGVWTPVLGGSRRLDLAMYLSLLQYPPRTLDLLVRVNDAKTASDSLSHLRTSLPPGVVMGEPQTADAVLRELGASLRFLARLLSSMALLVVLLSSHGVYALQRFRVKNLRRELGLRLALGATPQSLTRHVLAQTIRLVRMATVVGIFGALAAARGVQVLIPGAPPFALSVVAITTLLMCGVAVLASLMPAIRVARLDPAASLD